jgi:hypothetical protein
LGAGLHVEDSAALRRAAREARFIHYGADGASGLDAAAGAALLRGAKQAGATVTCDLISPRKSAMDALKQLLPSSTSSCPTPARRVSSRAARA